MSASFASPPYGEGKCLLRHRSNRPKLRNCPWTDTIPGHRSRQLGITQRSVGHLWKCEVCGYAFETTVSYATVTPLLCLDDFNSPVVGIYNRDHHHGISLLYRRAGRHRGVFAAERTLGLSVHSKQEPFFFRSCLTLWLLGSGLVGWFRQRRSCKHPNLYGSHGRNA